MKFSNFTAGDLNAINRRAGLRLKSQEMVPEPSNSSSPASSPGEGRVMSKLHHFGGHVSDPGPDEVRQAINRAFVENTTALTLSRNDMRNGLITASRKISERL